MTQTSEPMSIVARRIVEVERAGSSLTLIAQTQSHPNPCRLELTRIKKAYI